MKEDVAGRQGPRVNGMIMPGQVLGRGVSVGRIGGDHLLKLEISTGVNVVPLLLDSKVM